MTTTAPPRIATAPDGVHWNMNGRPAPVDASVGGDWSVRRIVPLVPLAFTLGLIVAAQSTGPSPMLHPPFFASAIVSAIFMVATWPGVAEAVNRATRDWWRILRVASFVARPAGSTTTTARATSPGLPLARAVVVARELLSITNSTRVAMIPVHPEHAEHMLTSERPVTVRRTHMRDVDFVALYETRPVSRIVAIARVTEMVTDAPVWLTIDYGARLDRTGVALDEYVGVRDHVTALALDDVYVLPEPLTVAEAVGFDRASGPVRYIEGAHLDHMRLALAGVGKGGA